MADDPLLSVLKEIRNWIRASSHGAVKDLIQSTLPDARARKAYQMFDGQRSMEQIRKACKMSPNGLLALANRCAAIGLLETNTEKKRVRLFDLNEFGLLDSGDGAIN